MKWVPKIDVRGPQGPQGEQGVQGIPGPGAVPADTAVAGYISTAGTSETKTALTAAADGLVTPLLTPGSATRDALDAIDRKLRITGGRGAASAASPRFGVVSPKSTTPTQYLGIPGVQVQTVQTLAASSAAVRYTPFELRDSTTITSMSFEVTTGPTADANVAVGIYATDRSMQPVDLLASSTVAVGTGFAGVKTATVSVILPAGVYLIATHVSANMTVRSYRGGMSYMVPGLGATAVSAAFTSAAAYSALPGVGRKWNGREAGGALEHTVTLAWGDAKERPRAGHFMLPSQELIKGVNLTVRPGTNWPNFWGDAWDWSGWVKKQIDFAKRSGANSVRICGDFQAVWTGMVTQAQFNARWRQIIDYAASLGMYTFANGGGASAGAVGTMTVNDLKSALVALGAEINGDPYVPGYDVIAENYAWAAANAAAVVPSIRAACDRPLTFSIPAVSDTFSNNFGGTTAQETLRPWVDYYDYHVYFNYVPSNVDLFFDTNSKPVMFGEFGGALSMGQSGQAARYAAVRGLIESVNADGKHVAGGVAWAAVDQSTTDDGQKWGMWASDGTPRTWITDEFRKFPVGR